MIIFAQKFKKDEQHYPKEPLEIHGGVQDEGCLGSGAETSAPVRTVQEI